MKGITIDNVRISEEKMNQIIEEYLQGILFAEASPIKVDFIEKKSYPNKHFEIVISEKEAADVAES